MELGMSRVRLSQYMKTSPKITAKTVRCSINSAQPRIKKDLDQSKKANGWTDKNMSKRPKLHK